MCACAFAAGLLLAIIGRAAQIEALALIGGYAVVFFGIGAAPFQPHAWLDPYARLTGAVLVGFSVLLVVGGLMADLSGLWDPGAAAVILVLPAIALHAVGVLRVAPARPARREARVAVATTRPTRQRIGLNWTVVGTLLWLGCALWTRDPSPGYWGMLATLNPLWYVGLVMVLIGFAIGRRSERSAALASLSFGFATTLTPALVYGAPREQTAAKQMQITQYVLQHHHIHATAGIYQAFSTMFSGVAAFAQLLGIHGMLGHMSLWSIATYWPVLLVLMRVGVLRFLMGRLLTTTSRRWCAVMLVLLVDSLGADYFSPQAVGYVIAIGIVAVAMNGLTPRPFGSRTTLLLLLLGGVALAMTHELSPYMATGALLILACFGQAPFWTCLPVGIPALIWAGVVHKAISQNFNFGSLFSLGNFRPPVTVATPGLHRLGIVGTQSHILLLALLALILLGAIGFLTNVRHLWAWAYALCPSVGIAFIAINPYGNEGIFRATLFAIPWLAVLAMRMPHPSRWVRLRRRGLDLLTASVALGLCALLGTFLIAAYAMDGTNVLPRSNVAITDYLWRQPPSDAFVLSVGSADNPADGATFAVTYKTLEWSQVANRTPELQQLHPTAIDVTALGDRYGQVASAHGSTPQSPLYLIWDRSSELFANAYGLQSTAEMNAWLQLLRSSKSWKLVDRVGGTYLFRLT